jgi:hypothetical protein
MRERRCAARLALAAAVFSTASACASRLYTPPAGPGAPFPEAAAAWTSLTERCRGVQRYVAEISVTGWVGATREGVGSTLHGALTREDDIYLEVRVLSSIALQMAGRAGQAVFLLPRDQRVLRAASRDIVQAMTGLNWGPRDLLNVLSGCVNDAPEAVIGERFDARASIDLGGGSRAWVRQVGGAWQLEAAARDGLLVEYLARESTFPSMVRVTTTASGITPLALTFRLGKIQANIDLEPRTFELDVPAGFAPMSLEDIRVTRPLREVKTPQ